MVELRKRKAPAEAAPPPPAKKNSNAVKKAIDKVKEAVGGNSTSSTTNGTAKIAVGQKIALDGFGGELETHTGEKVTLAKLLEQSQAGVVLFTYPKASTPGCTTQACLFRDNYGSITAPGLSVYGLSTDSAKSNTTFATKQSLPYPLLCDPSATLIGAIGMKKAPKSTTRGVVVIDKQGEVKVWEQAGPQKTVDAVMAYVQGAVAANPPPAAAAVANDTKMEDAPKPAAPAAAAVPAPTAHPAAAPPAAAPPVTDHVAHPAAPVEPTTTAPVEAPAAAPATAPVAAPVPDVKMTDAPPAPATAAAPTAHAAPTADAAAPTAHAGPSVHTATTTHATSTDKAESKNAEPGAPVPAAAPSAPVDQPPKMDEYPLMKEHSAEEVKAAEVAAEVGETAAKLDSHEHVTA